MNKLKILVPVKRVLDHQLKPLVNATHDGIQTQGFKFSINPFDDIAVEEALRIKTAQPALVETTHAISVGPEKAQDVLRNCLAKGIDSVSLVETQDELEPLGIAKLLAHYIKNNGFNMVIMGKQAIDDDCNNTGQMLAALLNWPQATNACKIEFNDSQVNVTREIDGGEEILQSSIPMVITTDLRLNQPRYVGLSKLMKVKKVKIPKLSIEKEFSGIDVSNKLKTLSIDVPPVKPPGVMLNNVDELITKLKDAKLL